MGTYDTIFFCKISIYTGSLDSDLTLSSQNSSPGSSPPSSPKMFPSHPSHHQAMDEAQQQQQQQQPPQHPHHQHQQHQQHPQQRLRVTMPTVTQQSSLNTPLPQSAGSPTAGINWILPSPDRSFYGPLFGILTPTSQPQQLSFSNDPQSAGGSQFSSHSEFSFDPYILTEDPLRQPAPPQQQQQPQQQPPPQQAPQQQPSQQNKYHPWATPEFEQTSQDQLPVIPKQEPFTDFCTGGPSSVETSSSQDNSGGPASVGLAEYNPSTSKGHEILSQVIIPSFHLS